MSDEQKIVDEVAEQTSTKSSDEIKTETKDTEEVVSKELPNRDIRTGMVIRVHERIKDITAKGEERERIQVFEGVVMGLSGKGIGRTMTVRKDSKGFMVEKIFPLASPNIVKVEVKKQYKVRRAKLSFLRDGFKRKLKEIK
jgi:large subunit ribosomal protein L19